MVRCRMIGRIHLVRIMAAAVKPVDVVVAEMLHHPQQLRILGEKIVPHVLSALRFEVLVFTVHGSVHRTLHQTLTVFRKQRVPMPAPDNFDDIPAGTSKVPFQLLDDFSVATHWPVQALKIAVNNKY